MKLKKYDKILKWNNFTEYCQKSKKIMIVTSTPDWVKFKFKNLQHQCAKDWLRVEKCANFYFQKV
jgi:hypothetical protein